MSKPWTAISYNWEAGNSHKIVFTASADSTRAKEEFEEQYPREDLVALIPGIHDWAITYPLTNFSGAFKD